MIWLPFSRAHYDTYRQWFEDTDLNKQLGPIDEEWLMHVLQEEDGQQYAVFHDNVMVGVIGVKHPFGAYNQLTITDIAVQPKMKGKGIGSAILSELSHQYPGIERNRWVAYVALSNSPAMAFFIKNKWVQIKDREVADDMIKFVPESLENEPTDTNAHSSL